MSDFLGNLMARSTGSVTVIQPRVPSLFEPYRPESSQPGTGYDQAWQGNAELESAGRPEAEPDSANVNMQNPMRISTLRSSVVQPEVLQTIEPIADAQNSNQLQRSNPPESVQPSLLLPEWAQREPRPGSQFPMHGRSQSIPQQSSLLENPRLRAEATPQASLSPGNDEASDWETTTGESTSPRPVSPSRSARAVSESPKRLTAPEMTGGRNVEPRLHSVDGLIRQQKTEELATSRIDFPNELSAGKVRSSRSAFPLAGRPALKHQTATPEPGSSEPPIKVTIGRIEVRAVFPETSVRPVPPARPKPTLSLDDYLRQRNRGQR